MATEVVVTLIPGGGGDYTTLSGAESGEQRDFVAADEIGVIECQSGSITDNVSFAGSTTDATRYIEVRPASGHEHGGDPTAGFKVASSSTVITIPATAVRIRGIVIQQTSTNRAVSISSTPFDKTQVSGCICFSAGSGSTAIFVAVSNSVTADIIIYNNIVFNWVDGIARSTGTQAVVHVYNNTVVGCSDDCFTQAQATMRAKNNIAQNATSQCYSGTFTDAETNISDDTTSPNASLQSISLTFADAANDDYHLNASDTAAIGTGTDLHADAILAFATDIDGDARPNGSWDIGADQTAAAAANELSGTPSAQATDASGTLDAVVSGSGTPQAGAATSDGELDTIDRASGAPQAGAATSTGTLDAIASADGAAQTSAATAEGTAEAIVSADGAPQSRSPTSAGTLGVVVSLSGTPQAGLADGAGSADDGQAPLIQPKRKGMIVDVGEILR